jgi:homoserine kinase
MAKQPGVDPFGSHFHSRQIVINALQLRDVPGHSESMQQATVRVPASTSNLGPGFDCLGVALRLYNSTTIVRGGKNLSSHIVDEAARLFFKQSGARPFPFSCVTAGDVPHSRGLGGSATVRLGVLHGLNRLAGNPLDRLSIFRLCAQLEGHPDNAGPASLGGFTVVGRQASRLSRQTGLRPVITRGYEVQRFEVSPALYFVFLIPDFEVKTSTARKILPARIACAAAVENCANACAITAAFASRNYSGLRGAFTDHLHQPFRKNLIPFLPRVIAAAEKAGALGAFLSGSGSAIGAVTLRSPEKIAAAMLRATRSTDARTLITTADNNGARLFRSPSRTTNLHGPSP